jgi:hypothetical protein
VSKSWLDDLVDSSAVKRHVAWAGELEFKSATESDRAGRTVQFLLRRQQQELASAHPFSAHTRRRRGHAGTMFLMSLEPLNGGPPLAGGAMLLNWASTPKGETVTFLINYEAERHPFLSCTRAGKDQEPTRWMAVFIEEDEQSAPVDQVQRAAVEQALTRKPKQQIKDSNLARLFTKNERFWRYMREEHGFHVTDEFEADVALKALLGIDSKADLDREPHEDWTLLREAFVQWQEELFGPLEG